MKFLKYKKFTCFLLLSGGILLIQPASASVKPETSLPAATAIYMKHDRVKAQKGNHVTEGFSLE